MGWFALVCHLNCALPLKIASEAIALNSIWLGIDAAWNDSDVLIQTDPIFLVVAAWQFLILQMATVATVIFWTPGMGTTTQNSYGSIGKDSDSALLNMNDEAECNLCIDSDDSGDASSELTVSGTVLSSGLFEDDSLQYGDGSRPVLAMYWGDIHYQAVLGYHEPKVSQWLWPKKTSKKFCQRQFPQGEFVLLLLCPGTVRTLRSLWEEDLSLSRLGVGCRFSAWAPTSGSEQSSITGVEAGYSGNFRWTVFMFFPGTRGKHQFIPTITALRKRRGAVSLPGVNLQVFFNARWALNISCLIGSL